MSTQDLSREQRVDQLYSRIHELLDRGETRKAQIIIEALLPADQAEIFRDLPDDEQLQILQGLPLEETADILEKLEDEEVAEIAGLLPPEQLANILDEMEPDEAADLLGDLPAEDAVRILGLMETQEEISPLLLHADETAGGLMTSEYLALGQNMWAERALEAIRQWAPEHEYLYYFVVDKEGHLVGVASLLQIIKASPKAELQSFMDRNRISATVDADQEACAQLMSWYDLTALPVVDDNQHLVGVITIDDIVDVLEDEATEDIQRLGGAAPLDKPYLRTSTWEVTRSRVGWLLLLFITGLITTSVMEHFEGVLKSVVALSIYVPLLIGTGGNAGSQTIATIIRALSVNEIDRKDALRVLWHEIRVGILMGLIVAIAGFLRAWIGEGDPLMGLTIGTAIGLIVFWSTSVGSLLPLIASLLGVDPTLVSGPLMSTVVDATGLFIYLTVAQWILSI
ncbi:MAG: magnesium transporter [Anaerolineae bacterium]|nr:magnesium transporter [Anaerolineae bacterium]